MTGRSWTTRRWRGGGAAVLLATLSLLAAAAVAQTAEERQVDFGKEIYKSKATCLFCHRWDGNGDQGYGGIALSLRKTQLTHDQLIETIKCGRPGTGMPYHDQFAYTDKRCYGVNRGDLGKAAPPQAVNFLAPREVQAVVAFVEAKIKGRGPATLEECIYFWGSETKECDTFKN
jgi:hypothetical protein